MGNSGNFDVRYLLLLLLSVGVWDNHTQGCFLQQAEPPPKKERGSVGLVAGPFVLCFGSPGIPKSL